MKNMVPESVVITRSLASCPSAGYADHRCRCRFQRNRFLIPSALYFDHPSSLKKNDSGFDKLRIEGTKLFVYQ